MTRPVIGITCYVEPASRGDWATVPSALCPTPTCGKSSRRAASRCSSRRAPTPTTTWPAAVLARLDGLVIAGGADVDPGRYGAAPHPSVQEPRPDRDALELALAAASRAERSCRCSGSAAACR